MEVLWPHAPCTMYIGLRGIAILVVNVSYRKYHDITSYLPFNDCSIKVFQFLSLWYVAKVTDMHGESSGDINIDLSFSFQYHRI